MFAFQKPNTEHLLDPEVSLIAHLALKPGTESTFESSMADALRDNRAEAGNISFTLFRVDGKKGEYYMVERWKNQAALDFHLQQDHAKASFKILEACLAFPLSDVGEHIMFVDELRPAGATATAST